MDATAWDERYRAADRLWSADPNLFVSDRLSILEPGRGLDLAAGDGRNAIYLSERGWSMTAVDFSGVAVELGRSLTSEVDFVVADVLDWSPATTFDLVLIAYLHIPRDAMRSIVSRSLGWLDPGGELFMIGHDVSNIEFGHGGPQVPEILWDVEEMESWVDGAVVTESQIVRRPVVVDDEVAYARDALVRARA